MYVYSIASQTRGCPPSLDFPLNTECIGAEQACQLFYMEGVLVCVKDPYTYWYLTTP